MIIAWGLLTGPRPPRPRGSVGIPERGLGALLVQINNDLNVLGVYSSHKKSNETSLYKYSFNRIATKNVSLRIPAFVLNT